MSFVLRVGGEAGWGIASASDIFSKLAIRLGYHVFASKDYASQIRGGHNNHTVRISANKVCAEISRVDILLALDKTTYDMHKAKVSEKGIIIIDDKTKQKIEDEDSKLIVVPLSEIRKKLNERNIHNAVFLGAAAKCLGIELKLLNECINVYFSKKPELAEKITEAAKEGYDAVEEVQKVAPVGNEIKLDFLTGNQALALGALKAGLTFHAQYPMTPATGILHHLAKEALTNEKLTVVQVEDEISVINFALGASAVGARAMCATSGGGFALMVESLGLAGMAEVPLVIVNGQRAGPSTGLPTKNAQGDLQFVLTAAPGDFPRVVIAPGDAKECYTEAKRSFYLAEKYQLPVIILIDKHICESFEHFDLKEVEKEFTFDYGKRINIITQVPSKELNQDGLYKRYAKGNLQRTLPGTEGGVFTYAGDEHDDVGYITEDPIIAARMNERRMEKLDAIVKELPAIQIIGPKDAELTIISWGSNNNAIIEAMGKVKGEKVNFFPIKYMCPFQPGVWEVLNKAKKLLLVESNYSGQLGRLIREETGIEIKEKLLRYDGTIITVEEICKRIEELI